MRGYVRLGSSESGDAWHVRLVASAKNTALANRLPTDQITEQEGPAQGCMSTGRQSPIGAVVPAHTYLQYYAMARAHDTQIGPCVCLVVPAYILNPPVMSSELNIMGFVIVQAVLGLPKLAFTHSQGEHGCGQASLFSASLRSMSRSNRESNSLRGFTHTPIHERNIGCWPRGGRAEG